MGKDFLWEVFTTGGLVPILISMKTMLAVVSLLCMFGGCGKKELEEEEQDLDSLVQVETPCLKEIADHSEGEYLEKTDQEQPPCETAETESVLQGVE